MFDIIYAVRYNTFKPIKSVRENGSTTTQQPALQGANAETYGIDITELPPSVIPAGAKFLREDISYEKIIYKRKRYRRTPRQALRQNFRRDCRRNLQA